MYQYTRLASLYQQGLEAGDDSFRALRMWLNRQPRDKVRSRAWHYCCRPAAAALPLLWEPHHAPASTTHCHRRGNSPLL